MYWLYSALLAAALLLTLPYWIWQRLRHGKYGKGLAERLGRIPATLVADSRPAVWVHAVSVGEVLAVSGLITELKRHFPRHRVVVSTTTDSGQKLARERFGEENVFYFPLDFAFAIRPYLRLLGPALIVIAETEFWPAFLQLAHESGVRIAVVNARISDRSWPGYRRFRWILKRILPHVDLFLAQTEEDARRLAGIGAPTERVKVSGNLKFDIATPAPPPLVMSLRPSLRTHEANPVLVCGSTVEGEEPILLEILDKILFGYPRAVMILAPRHPERFDQVARLLVGRGMHFWRRSQWQNEPIVGGVLLLDTIGELTALYALADIAFVGGSLVPRGGHNILEPAQYGVPIVVGEHTENFRDIVELFRTRDAVRVAGPDNVAQVLMDLISNPAERAAMGNRAVETLRSQMGATQRTLAALQTLMQTSVELPVGQR